MVFLILVATKVTHRPCRYTSSRNVIRSTIRLSRPHSRCSTGPAAEGIPDPAPPAPLAKLNCALRSHYRKTMARGRQADSGTRTLELRGPQRQVGNSGIHTGEIAQVASRMAISVFLPPGQGTIVTRRNSSDPGKLRDLILPARCNVGNSRNRPTAAHVPGGPSMLRTRPCIRRRLGGRAAAAGSGDFGVSLQLVAQERHRKSVQRVMTRGRGPGGQGAPPASRISTSRLSTDVIRQIPGNARDVSRSIGCRDRLWARPGRAARSRVASGRISPMVRT